MRRIAYWIFLALSVGMAVVALALGVMRVIEGELLYAVSNVLGVLALAALLYGGASYFKGSGKDASAADADSAEDDHGAADSADEGSTDASERVDHIDQAAEASEAEEDGQTV